VVFGLQVVNLTIGPHIARLHAQGDMGRLQRLVTFSTRAQFFFTLPFVVMLIFFGEGLVTLAFGQEFVPALLPLSILALGQLVNAASGSVGLLLAMTGHERDAARSVVLAAIVNVSLNAILIPPYGAAGAAAAGAVTLAAWNLAMCWAVRQRLGIDSLAFSIFPIKTG